ncbi:MAG: Gfo/Idh/MocA family oxidoreductase [Bacteroidales bacterium]|jgi:UDP-N-acetyl-2-amino-2-deoxyglucuronate dehydrogenase|nr:Gfo/Idh/MocA family oxidoreductase [Bacteroidales bacterium]MBQ5873679.1 Gfo/Idh/MocA family oxidoreductase [Bacteroidales bacterium]MBQ5892030.1 Gfo/Idh/MocA family oxidoreductase [Bacteroidales bacterium]
MKNFGIIGVGGYIAPRHLKAIKETGNNLIVALDKNDSVGIMDSYFPQCSFYTEYERFDRFVEKIKHTEDKLDFVTVCTPNYLHDSHIRFGLRAGADVICEKPLVLNPWNIDALQKMEEQTGRKVYNILQLRLHPAIIEWKNMVDNGPKDKVYDVDLTYITSRGLWYYTSWKGDSSKSGGVATNIGVHFYDMLSWIFGSIKENIVHIYEHDRAAGLLLFERARVRYFMSINADTLPKQAVEQGKRTYRKMEMDGKEIEFSDGFTELHTESYKKILAGEGFGLDQAYQSIKIVHDIRNTRPIGLKGDYHPLAALPLSVHPFYR